MLQGYQSLMLTQRRLNRVSVILQCKFITTSTVLVFSFSGRKHLRARYLNIRYLPFHIFLFLKATNITEKATSVIVIKASIAMTKSLTF